MNYGSRAEIVTAFQEIAEEVAKGEIHAEEIDDELIAKHLMTGFLPKELQDPELMIRTSGEERISNFLLWQIAYSELISFILIKHATKLFHPKRIFNRYKCVELL
ncbi:hypothetical protein EfmAA94_09530 [Enterococcus faecium]|nr:hypothetical protein EfmAA94_09530 [Enterococcus faecium]